MAVITFQLRDGRPAVLGLRPDSTALALDETAVSSYDLAGRPYAIVREPWTFRRALDGRLLQKRGQAGRVRRVLDADEAGPVVESARRDAEAVLEGLGDGHGLLEEAASEARRRLRRIAEMDEAALAADAVRFRSVYRPVGVLPPDQYLALVLQATEGCAWNACTFCRLYRDVPFRAKTEREFSGHVADVLAFFGESIALRRSVFLGGANALCLPHERVTALLETARGAVAVRGVHAFVDVWTGARRTVAQWTAYAQRGLRRVYIGLESGDADLLRWLEKPFAPDQAVDLVRALRAAGIPVGVIVLLGAGGERFDRDHVERSADVLSRMELGGSDLLYFSEFVPSPDLEYVRRARAASLQALPTAACTSQRRRILAGMRPGDPEHPPRSATYDIREFVY